MGNGGVRICMVGVEVRIDVCDAVRSAGLGLGDGSRSLRGWTQGAKGFMFFPFEPFR